MDIDSENWAAVHQQLLEEPGRAAIPSHLQNYSPDVHGTIFETPGRWLAEFGCSSPCSNAVSGVPGVQRTDGDGSGSLDLPAGEAGKVGSEPGFPGAALQQQVPRAQHHGLWTLQAQPGSLLGQPQQQQLQQMMGSSNLQQQQQHGSTQQTVACSPQQHQQQAQLQIAQLQGIQLLQQQQQQPVLNSCQQQQLWGLQQQLWTLQQQAALISQQQQQLGIPLAVVMPQQQQQQAGQQVSLPMQLSIPVSLTGMQGASAASFTASSMHQQQQQQQQGLPGLPSMGLVPNGLPHVPLSVAAAAAANPAAHAKRGRAPARRVASAPASAASTAAAAAAAAAAAMAAVPHAHMQLQLGLDGVKKPKERHRSVVGQLEAELQEKMAQLQVLSAENEMLKLRAVVLEAAVQSREDQMRVISEQGPPVYPADSPTPAAPRSVASAAVSNTSGDTGSPTAAAAAATAAVSSRSVLPADLQSSGSTAAGEAGAAAAAAAAVQTEGSSGEGAAAAAGEGVGSGSPSVQHEGQQEQQQEQQRQQHHVATLADFRDNVCGARAAVKAMSVEDIIRHWKQFLQDVTGELVNVQREESMAASKQQAVAGRPQGSCAAAIAANADAAGAADGGDAAAEAAAQAELPLSPSHQRINDMVAKYSFLVKTAQQLNPSAYCRLFGTNLDTSMPAPYSDAHWRRVVSVLGLTKHQVNHILACAELYFCCRAKLQNEQRVLQQHLKETAASTEGMLLSGAGDDSAMKPWLDRLASNLKREHVLRVMLNSFVWGKIFSPVQCAKAAVYSHPWYVDVHAIVCVMCEDALTMPTSVQRPLVFSHRLQTSPTQQMVM